MSIRNELARAAKARGLPTDAHPRDIQAAHEEWLRRNINRVSSRAQFGVIPIANIGEAVTVEVAVGIETENSAFMAIREGGDEEHKDMLRRRLGQELVTALLNAGYVDVRAEDGKAIAALNVCKPE